MKSILHELKTGFTEAVARNEAEGILFSGGLDSALVALHSRDSRAVSVGLESYGEDRTYAHSVAAFLGLEHYHVTVTVDDAVSLIPEVIRIKRSFDPVVPNDIAVYCGLKYAKDMGLGSMMTGDGSDEIFVGYDFMLKEPNLEEYLARLYPAMQFSSNMIGQDLDVVVRQPFLDREFVEFSKGIGVEYKVRQKNGTLYGKWILRKAFEDALPPEIVWQSKRPLECGSGMTKLRDIIESRVSDKEFEEGRRKCPVKFWNKEHYYYYCIYRRIVGEILPPAEGEMPCQRCGAGMSHNSFHCYVCGDVKEWNKTGR